MDDKRFMLFSMCIDILAIFVFSHIVRVQAAGGYEGQLLPRFKDTLIIRKELILGGAWSDERSKESGKNAVGFEVLKKFSHKRGDWGSVLVQLRIVRYDNYYMYMNNTRMSFNHIDGMHDWELEFHDAYFQFRGPLRRKINVKIGHFDVPYGLEQHVDTHTTLVQLMAGRNIGFKKDWGISLAGQFPRFGYELAFTRGSGFEYREHGKNFLISARVGTPVDQNFMIGISGLYGKPIDAMGVMRGRKDALAGEPPTWFDRNHKPGDDIIKRWRTGLDSIYIYGPYTFKGEVSYGADVNQEVINAIFEARYLFPGMDERLEATVQIQSSYQDISGSGGDNDSFMLLGLSYRITKEVTLQSAYRHDLERLQNTNDENVVAIQAYCNF